jgi:hypothetical protein
VTGRNFPDLPDLAAPTPRCLLLRTVSVPTNDQEGRGRGLRERCPLARQASSARQLSAEGLHPARRAGENLHPVHSRRRIRDSNYARGL